MDAFSQLKAEADDPGLNPARGILYGRIYMDKFETTHMSRCASRPTTQSAKVPRYGFLANIGQWPGSEPLSKEADPLHSKLDVEYECRYKMVQ